MLYYTSCSHHVPQETDRQKYRSLSVSWNIEKMYPWQQRKYLAVQWCWMPFVFYIENFFQDDACKSAWGVSFIHVLLIANRDHWNAVSGRGSTHLPRRTSLYLLSRLMPGLHFFLGIRAYSYSAQGSGAMILTKVVLGKVYNVDGFAAVSSCPAGYNSVSN